MPVKIGTGSGAVDLSTLRAGDAEVQKVMVGTGSSAIEAWSNQTSRVIRNVNPTHWFQFTRAAKVDTITGNSIADPSNKLQDRGNHVWTHYNSASPASFVLGSASSGGVTIATYFQATGAQRGYSELLVARGDYFTSGSNTIFIGINKVKNGLYYGLRLTGTNYSIRNTPTEIFAADGGWHQLIFSARQSAGRVYYTAHIDGAVVDTFDQDVPKTMTFPSGDKLYFGSNHMNDNNSFDGNLDDVMWFDRQISAAEVSLLAAEPRTA